MLSALGVEIADEIAAERVAKAEKAAEAAAIEALEPVAEAPRPRGRPKKEGGAKSRAEITREYRARNAVSKIEVSGGLAERVRAMRMERGVTIEALLAAALNALDAPLPIPPTPTPPTPTPPTPPAAPETETDRLVRIASEAAKVPVGHRSEEVAPGKTVLWLWPEYDFASAFSGLDAVAKGILPNPDWCADPKGILLRADGRADVWCSDRYDGVGRRAISTKDTVDLAAEEIGRGFKAAISNAKRDRGDWLDPEGVDFRARATAEMERLGVPAKRGRITDHHSATVGCGLHLQRGAAEVRVEMVRNGQIVAVATSIEGAVRAGWAFACAGKNKKGRAEALAIATAK